MTLGCIREDMGSCILHCDNMQNTIVHTVVQYMCVFAVCTIVYMYSGQGKLDSKTICCVKSSVTCYKTAMCIWVVETIKAQSPIVTPFQRQVEKIKTRVCSTGRDHLVIHMYCTCRY